MPRDRRASEPWSTQSPETPQYAEPEPKWASLTDTGSMQPSAEALAWQRQADAWAQQAESDDSQAVEPANRWSEVASTGRTAFPADGVGWRTETAEWRATGGARWRQTTEWRSTTGSHGWRSTTEAWQTSGNGDYRAPVSTPTEQPAISSTAYSAPASTPPTASADSDSRPSWQQFTEPATPSWQQPAPSWQQPAQRQPAESTSSWQQLVEPGSRSGGTIEGSATWNDSGARAEPETPSWQQRREPETPSWQPREPETPSWQHGETTTWQTPRDDGRHLVREDDRAAWRRDTDLGEESRQIGRRRAPEPGSRTSGGTGWTARSDADNWAGHTDTGSIQLYPEPENSPAWGARSEGYAEPTGRRALPTNGYDEGPTRRVDPDAGRHGTGRPALPSAPYEEDATARRYAAGLADLADPEPRRGRNADNDFGSAAAPTSSYGTAGFGTAAAPTSSYGTAAAPTSGYAPDGPPASAPTSGYAPISRRRGARYADEEQRPGGPIGEGEDPRYVDGARAAAMPATRRPPEPEAPPVRRGQGDETNAGQPPLRTPGTPGKPRKARYHDGAQNDWREQTGAWVAEPDTSSWTRDPDTGQWSRSKDDPRVLAWREEAARREEAQQSAARRELPAAPADEERRASWSQPPADAGRAGIAPASAVPDDGQRRGMRPDDPGMGGAPMERAPMPAAPRSAMPAAPRSAMPAAPRSSMPAAPRSSMPAAPRSSMPAAPRSAMPAAPRSAMPADGSVPRMDDTMSGRGMADGGRRRAMEDGPIPRSAMPADGMGRRGIDDPRGSMADGGMGWRGMPDGPIPRSAMPGDGMRGPAPRSAMPDDGLGRRGMPDDGMRGPAPRSAMPDDGMGRRGIPDGPIPRSAMPDDAMRGPASRGATPYDTMARRGMEDDTPRRGMASPTNPRSAMPDPGMEEDTLSRRRRADRGAAPDDSMAGRGMAAGPAPRSAMPDDTWSRRADDTSAGHGMPGRWGQGADPAPRRSRRRDNGDEPSGGYGLPAGNDDVRGGAPGVYGDAARGGGYGGGPAGYDHGGARGTAPGAYGADPRSSTANGYSADPRAASTANGYSADPRGGSAANGFAADPRSGSAANGFAANPRGDATNDYGAADARGGASGGYSGSPRGSNTPGAYDDPRRSDLRDGAPGTYGDDPRSSGTSGGYGLRGDYDDDTRRGMPDGPRPRSAMPAAPRSALPAGPVRGQRALPSAPRSAMPSIDPDAPISPIAGGGTYGGGSYRAGAAGYPDPGRRRADDTMGGGRRRAAEPDAWRRDLDPDARQPRSLPGYDDPDEWRATAAARDEGDDDDRGWPPRGGAAPADWRNADLEEASRGHAAYREGGSDGWRQELSAGSDLTDGESRRYGTSDFVPFRSSGSAAVPRQSNLSMTSTSMVMPAGGPDPAAVRPQRAASNGYMAPGGAYERRPVGGGFTTGRRSNLLDPDDEEDDQAAGGPLAAVGYTVIWYGVPVVLFVLYMLIINRGSQTHALDTAAKAAPQFGVSLVLSLLVAVGIRLFNSSWKAISVGLAAAVVGGGLATVVSSALTGNSLS
ncbi:hypothetical protein [Actinoplanes sp. NPDC051411]|uniref:hypothetical protein n=1 Tax=Actinoplanes sp. NPDC051411 TaxID=3155522 RepID=UPI00341D400C